MDVKGKEKPAICESCMSEAKSVFGIYGRFEKVPRNLQRKLEEEYDNQYYFNHEGVE